MKLEDVWCGDWIMLFNQPTQIYMTDESNSRLVNYLDEETFEENSNEILLTDEILEKNLQKEKNQEGEEFFAIYNGLFVRRDKHNGYVLRHSCFGNRDVTNTVTYLIHYVHELQHWLKILNYNKKIIL